MNTGESVEGQNWPSGADLLMSRKSRTAGIEIAEPVALAANIRITHARAIAGKAVQRVLSDECEPVSSLPQTT